MAADDVDDLADLELMDELEMLGSDGDDPRSESVGSRSSDAASEAAGDSDDDGPQELTEEHYKALRSTVIDIVTALGGLEDIAQEDGSIESVYAIGDDCLRCLRDLRSLLHHDQEDQRRTVPRIFGEVNVVQRGLLPLLLKTADMGERGSKIALACTDILTTLTWPIDIAAEQRAIMQKDGDASALDSLSHMQNLLVSYKLAVLKAKSGETRGTRRSVLSTVMLHILLPSLSKPRHQRSERDTGTISMCLHLFRNLVAIKDPLATSLSSHEQIALSNLQNDLVSEMHKSHVLNTVLMLASNAESRNYEPWNVVAAEFVLHIFVGSDPACLLPAKPTMRQPASGEQSSHVAASSSEGSKGLQRLLMSEAEARRDLSRGGASRHSRFTTTISFRGADGELRTALSQTALRKNSDRLNQQWKEKTQRIVRRRKNMDEVGVARKGTQWSTEARSILTGWSQEFLKIGFEPLVRSVVKDVRTESAKAGDLALTRVRVMQLSTFFLRLYLLLRDSSKDSPERQEPTADAEGEEKDEPWSFDLVSYWLEPWSFKLAWMRAADAREDRAWLEFVTAVKLWTTLLQTVEALSKSAKTRDQERADGIQAVHFYDELALDTAKAVTKSYTAQSFRCLQTIIEFSYVMPRLLERYSKDKDNLYIKAKRQMRQGKKDGENIDADDQQTLRRSVDDQIKERKFEFEKFQSHISSHQLVEACIGLLLRWRDVRDDFEEHMTAGVHVLHRLVVKSASLRLVYPYRHRAALRKLEQDAAFWHALKSSTPQVAVDAARLFKYIFTKYERLDDSEKAMWAEGMKAPKSVRVFKMPAEIQVQPSRGREEDVRIAVGLLVEKELLRVVTWVKGAIEEAARVKAAIVAEERDKQESADEDEGMGVPRSALERFEDHQMAYNDNDSLREDASTRPEAKLLCRLLEFTSVEEDDHHWRWAIPAHRSPEALEQDAELLDSALRFPVDLFGESFSSCVTKVRKAPVRARTVVNENGQEEEVYVPRGRGARKNPKKPFFDDDIIEDSDEELEAVARLMANGEGGAPISASQSKRTRGSSSEVSDDSSSSESEASSTAARNRPSLRRARESSATSSSTQSPARDAAATHTAKRKKLLKRRARPRQRDTTNLFLGSDSDDDDAERADTTSQPSTSPPAAHPADLSDEENEARTSKDADERAPLSDMPANAIEGSDGDNASGGMLARKRRALILSDDDDDY